MLRRNFLAISGAGFAGRKRVPLASRCDCAPAPPAAVDAFGTLQSCVKITGMKVFGVSLTPASERPYVFVKLETNQGVTGWGEGTLEGKAAAVMACINDFRDFLIGSDPMQVEHHWQSMYVHSFYRAGPVIGSAISGIDQALWDLRAKARGMPVYKLLGGGARQPRSARLLSRECFDQGTTRGTSGKRDENRRFLHQGGHTGILRMDRDSCQNRAGC